MLESRWIIDKAEVAADAGLVVTKDVLAIRAGLAMLERGGNAVDAGRSAVPGHLLLRRSPWACRRPQVQAPAGRFRQAANEA